MNNPSSFIVKTPRGPVLLPESKLTTRSKLRTPPIYLQEGAAIVVVGASTIIMGCLRAT